MTDHTNYYDVLGVEKSASVDEIRSKFKKLAMKWHPDRNQNNKEEAEKKFMEITEAHDVLTSETKRDIYDKLGYDGLKQSAGGEAGQMGNPFDLIQQLMGGGSQRRMMVPPMKIPVRVELELLYSGGTIEKEIERRTICDKCDGAGTKSKHPKKCTTCKGKGAMLMQFGPGMMQQVECSSCRGNGIDASEEKCKKCKGNKYFEESITLKIEVPKGAHDDFPVLIENQGHQLPPDVASKVNKPRTDVAFILKEGNHKVFRRGFVPEKNTLDFGDLHIGFEVTLLESLTGFTKEITHLDGSIFTIKIDKRVRHGDIYVAVGKGMPKLDSPKFGDLFITIETEHPETIKFPDSFNEKLAKALGVKLIHPKKDIQNPVDLISFSAYKIGAKIQADSDAMKESYKNRNRGNSDEDDDSDADGDGEMPQGVQCPVQ